MQKNTYNPLWCVAINLLHAAALNSPNPSQVVLNSVKPLRTDLRGFSSSSAKALITSIATSELICKQRCAGLGAEPYIWGKKPCFVKSDRARNAFTGQTHCLRGRKSEFTLRLNTNFCLLVGWTTLPGGISKSRFSGSIQRRFEQLMIGQPLRLM